MNFDEWREIYSTGPLMNEAMARAAWDAAIVAEREACAELMERQHAWITNTTAANAIRERINT